MVTRRLVSIGLALAATVAVTGWTLPAQAQQRELTIFAAASLKNALDEAAGAWARGSGQPMPRISYAGSNALARQIEQGAPADLFISADSDWMDYVAARSLIRTDSRIDLLGNRIVLVAAKDRPQPVSIAKGFDLAGPLRGGRLAMANVDAVPAGRYGKAALETLGAWEAVKDKVAQAENVRAALLLVSRGEAPLGIVYATDAASEPNVAIVGTFPADSHAPIVYPAAILRDSRNEAATAFLAHLRSTGARSIFEMAGFTVLARPVSGS